MKKLNRITLVEELEESGFSTNLIETLVEASEGELDTAIVCSNETELHNAIQEMSAVEVEE